MKWLNFINSSLSLHSSTPLIRPAAFAVDPMNQEPASPTPAAAAAASALEGASLNSSLTAMDWLPKGPFLNDVKRPLDPLIAD